VYVSNDEVDELRAKVMQLQNRLLEVRAARDRYRDELRNRPVGGDAALRERVERYRRELDALRAERLAAPRVERVKVEKVREVKVRDSQVEDGLRAQLEDLRAKTVFLGDQKRAAEKEVARLHRELNLSASKAKAAVEGLGTATATAKALRSRIGALESRLGALQTERDEAYEQVALIYGEPRKLTSAELAGLRRTGPAGEALLARALKLLARARAERGDLNKALMAVAEAAINWRDRIR
jgi:chromosome segregation ATPase